MRKRLRSALRTRGVVVSTPIQEASTGDHDERQLAFATDNGFVVYTYNVGDFCRLHGEWLAAGREHAGIILVQQQRYSIGEQLRRILLIRSALSADDMRNRAEFLSNWG